MNDLEPKSVPIRVAARMLGKSEQFVRIGLINKQLPIGVAVKQSKNRYNYYISPKLLYDFCGKMYESDGK